MKGLELSKKYYAEVWQELLHRKYPQYEELIAVGLVGEGSQCYGYDDELSRDHDWGAEIYLWLRKEEYEQIGESLRQEFAQLPASFQGYPCDNISALAQGRTGVWEIGAYYRKFLAVPQVPQTMSQWRIIPEDHLSVVTNGEVFRDDLGEFTAIRRELQKGYPEDIKKKKLARRLLTMAQAGQYNYPRLLQRKDKIASQLALDEFIKAAISAVYLLNNKYMPYYKWAAKGMEALAILGIEIREKLQILCSEEYGEWSKAQEVEEISALIIEELRRQGLSKQNGDFLLEHGYAVHNTIADSLLRASNPWVE